MLATIWAEVLDLDKVGIHDNFFELGGDSILGIQIIAKANEAGLRLTPQQLFQHQTIAELADVAGTTPSVQAEQGIVTGPAPLTPIQRWFFEQDLPEPHHWNQTILLEARQTLDPSRLERALEHLLVQHDALRLRFVRDASSWQQVNTGFDGGVPFAEVALSALPETAQGAAIETAAAEFQSSLNLSEGPLMRVALFDLGPRRPSCLLIVMHHLAVDVVSWGILLEDLQRFYQQLGEGEAVQPPVKTTSYRQWAEQLVNYAQSAALWQELDYWLTESRRKVAHLPVDYPEGIEANTEASARIVSVSLGVEETQALLREVPKTYNTQISEVLLTSLVQAFAQWTGKRSLLIDLEGHGREAIFEDVDLSRTVGWFTAIYPVLLELGQAEGPEDALKTIKEQLRGVPNGGIGYGVLRYLSGEDTAERLRAFPQAEVSFNYLGQIDRVASGHSLFGLAPESSGPSHGLQGRRPYLLELNGLVTEGQFQLNWAYSENLYLPSVDD
jgi:non-ribosomal peptide synthase protein (TIGR01720 family)